MRDSNTSAAPVEAGACRLILDNLGATERAGACLAAALTPGLLIFLHGNLGAGKTTLVRAVLRALGFAGRVKSPTYTLVELYTVSSLHLYHFDFYRFNDAREWEDAGFREVLGGVNVCLVEWPERAAGLLPAADLSLHLSNGSDEHARDLSLAAHSPAGQACLSTFARCFAAAPIGLAPPVPPA